MCCGRFTQIGIRLFRLKTWWYFGYEPSLRIDRSKFVVSVVVGSLFTLNLAFAVSEVLLRVGPAVTSDIDFSDRGWIWVFSSIVLAPLIETYALLVLIDISKK